VTFPGATGGQSILDQNLVFALERFFCSSDNLLLTVLRLCYGLDDRGSFPGRCIDGIFLLSLSSPDRLWAAPSLLTNGYRGLLTPGVKRPGREGDPLTCI